jgi:hypothetical protein
VIRKWYKEYMSSIVVQFYVLFETYRARVTVRHIKAKHTKTRKSKHSTNGVTDQAKEETLVNELMDAYLITWTPSLGTNPNSPKTSSRTLFKRLLRSLGSTSSITYVSHSQSTGRVRRSPR